MILLDTNILGTFSRIGATDLLWSLFEGEEIGVSPAVYEEVVEGVREGRSFLQTIAELVQGRKLRIFSLTPDEVLARVQLPRSLNAGEAESIAVCVARGAAFLTNDQRARNYCRSIGVEVFDLPELLRSLWKLRVCSRRRVRQLVNDIELKEGVVFKHKERIFAP